MNLQCGDAYVFTKDPGTLWIWPKSGRRYYMTIAIREGMTWHDFTELAVTPALRALGWELNNWHRPRADPLIICVAFVWRTAD